jgi:rhamnosyltransferase subunit B
MLARLQPALPGMGRVIARFARWVTRSWPEPIYQLRSELGLGRGPDPIFEAKHSPYLVLAMFSPLLGEPQPDWPASTKVTGFVFYDGDAGDLPPAIEQFLEQGPPPLVFTLGSAAVLDAGDFYQQSALAAGLIGQRAVLLVGSDPRNVPNDVPQNVCVANYAPYSRLFPRASVLIHQGGVGTTAQALRSGKPMLVMPYSHDQPDNARRVRRLGVARVIRRSRYTAELAARRITLLLENAAIQKRAARIGERLRSEDGLKAACDALEALGKGRP